MAEVTLESVTKEFQDGDETVVAVDDVSIEIEDGEFLVLVGPSGCGKSTTLRMIAGLETITSGTISIDDDVVNHVPAQHRDIAMVFQSYALYPHMTVRGNMAFGLEESTTLERDVVDQRVRESAEMMGIGDLLDRKPADLSGGQQQRVALGRAIVRDPEVFLMDEPLSNLDAKLRAQMRTELQRLQAELGTTTIYVTHDQTEAMTMGDRIAILDDGELQQVGTPLECYHRPNNRFVAGFIGDPPMNFVEVTNDDGVLRAEAFDYPLPEETANAVAEHEKLILGIRPEDIELNPKTASSEYVLDATVDVVEPTGDENVVYLALTEDALTSTGSTLGSGHVGSETVDDGAGGEYGLGSRSVDFVLGAVGGIGRWAKGVVQGIVPGGSEATEDFVEDETEAEIGSTDSSRIVSTVGGMQQYESGQSVTAYVPPDAIHLFNPATSEAVHNRQLDQIDRAPSP